MSTRYRLVVALGLVLMTTTGSSQARIALSGQAAGNGGSHPIALAPSYVRVDSALGQQQSRVSCAPPAVPDAADLIVYGGYEADAISSAYVGGPDQETNLIDVQIEPGRKPLYLVLSSYESMVWRVSGATGRIAHVVVSSNHHDDSGYSASGVIGLNRTRVTIAAPNCPYYGLSYGGSNHAGTSLLIAGRRPDAAFKQYSASVIALPSGQFRNAPRNSAARPAGFDPAMWEEATRYWPGGLVMVDPQKVITPAKVANYAVLPSQMGLAQLLGNGAIRRTADRNTFLIARPIVRFPPSMGGAHSVTLRLGQGVPMPAGDAGHSCVISSAGAALRDSMLCR